MSGKDSILEGMQKVSEDTPGYCPRPKEDQYLRLWDEVDLKRLNLTSLSTLSNEIIKSREFEQTHDEEVYKEPEIDQLEQIKRN